MAERLKIRYVHIRDGTPLTEEEIKELHEFLRSHDPRPIPKYLLPLGGESNGQKTID